MHVYCCQFNSLWEDKAANYQRLNTLLNATNPQPGSLICLPEMFATGYVVSENAISLAENPITGATIEVLTTLAQRYHSYFVAGITTHYPAALKPHNSAIVISPTGEHLAFYEKLHPFTFAGEHHQYAAGNRTVQVAIPPFTLSPFICYDLRFPEIFRTAALAGANLFVVIANWPASRIAHWTTLLRARAIENQAYVVGVNRCGDDPHIHYSGDSLIVSPLGEILAHGDPAKNTDLGQMIFAELDFHALENVRRQFPVLSDMRLPYVYAEK